jgi:hypothetical protein
MRRLAVLLALLAALGTSAASPKKKPAPPMAPVELPHTIAMFLGTLSRDGARSVTFKAAAMGTRFFFEEPTGVTIYRFADGRYVKEEFLRGYTLKRALKRFEKKNASLR